MTKNIFILMILLSVGYVASAQNYKKTFKALEEENYTTARIGFQQAQHSVHTKSLGDYGMAVVYRSTSLRIEDMYKACANINSAKNNWGEYDEKLKKKYSMYLTEDIIEKEKNIIYKKLYGMLKKSSETKEIQKFIDQCPDEDYKKLALILRDSLAYNKVKRFNTISAYKGFIANYPKAKQIDEATNNMYNLAWDACIRYNDIESYETFIAAYKDAPQHDSAKVLVIELEYQRAVSINTSDAFDSFISEYPKSPQAELLKNRAEENAYSNVLKFETLSICGSFISTYPSSKYLEKVVFVRDSLAFMEAKQINTNEAYENFVFSYPSAMQIPTALALMTESMYSRIEIMRMIAKNSIKSNGVKSLIIYRTDPNDSTKKLIESMKSYDLFGNIISETEEFAPASKKETKYNFDDAGDKLMKKMTFTNDKIRELFKFEYDIKGLNLSSTYQCQFDCRAYGESYSDSLTHDDKRNLVSEIKYDSSSKRIESHYYLYDKNGNRMQDSILVWVNDSLDYSIIKFNYNWQGNIIQEMQESSTGERLYVNSYSYDGIGKLTTSTTYDASGTIYRIYFYNAKGLLESEYLNYEEYKNNGFRRDYVYTFW